ncbi:helix-turn-helix domain-containing protein [Algihabitans albus]|uniref:helix-turn-helix domain-containing protein n=1 Tax=Algihabitans albus TaxID=2164067 RepID=UPI0038B2C11E
MRDRLADDISLSDIADSVGLSPQHFARAFSRETGMPPHRYLMGLRVERAREFLAESNLPLAAVAIKSGFCSQSHMTTAFKRVLGTTPGRYRVTAKAW